MSGALPVPEPVTWTLPTRVTHNGVAYGTVTLRAPTAGDILKATAIRGAVGLDVTLRLIEAVSAEHCPYELLKGLPAYLVMQMGEYMDEFVGQPAPDPLEAWRAARRAAAAAELTETSETDSVETALAA